MSYTSIYETTGITMHIEFEGKISFDEASFQEDKANALLHEIRGSFRTNYPNISKVIISNADAVDWEDGLNVTKTIKGKTESLLRLGVGTWLRDGYTRLKCCCRLHDSVLSKNLFYEYLTMFNEFATKLNKNINSIELTYINEFTPNTPNPKNYSFIRTVLETDSLEDLKEYYVKECLRFERPGEVGNAR